MKKFRLSQNSNQTSKSLTQKACYLIISCKSNLLFYSKPHLSPLVEGNNKRRSQFENPKQIEFPLD